MVLFAEFFSCRNIKPRIYSLSTEMLGGRNWRFATLIQIASEIGLELTIDSGVGLRGVAGHMSRQLVGSTG